MRFFIVFILISFNLAAQESSKYHYSDFVEAYYDKASEKPIYIYDRVNGNIIDTISIIKNENAYYKIAISDSEFGWFKLKNIQRLPEERQDYGHENRWVKSKNFIIHVDNYDENHQIYLYDLPSKKSNRIHKLEDFQITSVVEISDLWAKVKFKVGKKAIEGWLDFKDQCAYPWTTCPKYD
ncbi:hypothetical protein WNY78_06765 [Psychroserpens sp. AS72]|uniref:hypothetical protein n=1 Tax=Psychroserpens sp. AS72 TaxID=3135775 RepID=UPI00317AF9A4